MSAIGNKLALQTPVPTSVCYVQSGSVGEEQGEQRLAQPLYRQGGCAGWEGFFYTATSIQWSPLSQGKKNRKLSHTVDTASSFLSLPPCPIHRDEITPLWWVGGLRNFFS